VDDPLSKIVRFGLEAFDEITALPLKLPEDWGAKLTVSDVVCPGAKLEGVLSPEMPNPVPATESWLIVAFTPPIFCMVTVWV
jgi:hypothetical protein